MDERLDIPAIGAAKGLFEMLVPGVFLLLNLGWTLYYFQGAVWDESSIFKLISDNTILMLVVIIVMGYLTGVVIWLLGSNGPDKLSSLLSRILFSKKEPYYTEDFPYIESLGDIAEINLPPLANRFHLNCWLPQKTERGNKYFFNYCKTLINSIDPHSAKEIYANEALIRYIAAMFYALSISLGLILIIFINELIKSCSPYIDAIKLYITNQSASHCSVSSSGSSIQIDCLIFIFFYFISILILLCHFRYMRFKEVQTVFTATLINKDKIGSYLSDDQQCSKSTETT